MRNIIILTAALLMTLTAARAAHASVDDFSSVRITRRSSKAEAARPKTTLVSFAVDAATFMGDGESTVLPFIGVTGAWRANRVIDFTAGFRTMVVLSSANVGLTFHLGRGVVSPYALARLEVPFYTVVPFGAIPMVGGGVQLGNQHTTLSLEAGIAPTFSDGSDVLTVFGIAIGNRI